MNPTLQERAANSNRQKGKGRKQVSSKQSHMRRQRAKTPPPASMNPWADLATVMTDDDQGGTNDIE